MKTLKTKTFFFLVGLILLGSSCKKNDLENVPNKISGKAVLNEQGVSNLQTKYLQSVHQLQGELFKNLKINSSTFRVSGINDFGGGCGVVTKDSIGNMTIDYGSGCAGDDGHTYSGVITLTRSIDELNAAGSFLEFSFDNVLVDTTLFNGVIRLDGFGHNANGNLNGRLTSTLSVDFKVSGYSLAGSQLLDVEVVDIDPNNEGDEIYVFTGGGTGINSSNLSFTQTILTPLQFKGMDGCDHFVEGALFVETQTMPDKTINYGTGRCDNEVLVTENGVTTLQYLD